MRATAVRSATACSRTRSGAPAHRYPARAGRLTRVHVVSKLVLQPIGTGSCEHLEGESVTLPGPVVLREGTLDVGRVEPCDVILAIPTVSSRHAILTVEGEKVLVIDLNSTNGTVVDGREIRAMDYVEIPIGGEIIFGDEFLAKFQLQRLPDDVTAAATA